MVDPTDLRPTLRHARRAIELDSTNVVAWHTVAIALADTGNLEAGTEAWRACVRRGPSYTQCLAFLGLAHYWRRQYDSAAAWADSAIAVDPNYVLGRTTAGSVAIERRDFSRAAAAFDAARRLSSAVEVVNALAGSAQVEARAGRRSEARTILRRADSLASAYVPAPLHTAVFLAQAHAAVGEADRALAWLTQYEPGRDLHFQLHLRCDPPFDPLRGDKRFRSLLVLTPPMERGC
ncbi:MAG: hypothetical protein ACR2G6_10700 [Gemmatimonadaceae bacterium]